MAKLDKNTALRLSEPVEDAYLECIDRLIANIAKHLGTGKAFRTADWETRKLAELGQLTQENAKIINEATKRVPMEIRLALEKSSRIALEDVEKLIKQYGFKIIKHAAHTETSWQVYAQKVADLPIEEQKAGIDFEFNLPLPNNTSYHRNEEVFEALQSALQQENNNFHK